MAKSVKATRHIIPPRRKSSLIRREKSNLSSQDAVVVRPNRHLIVTTTRGVFTWGNNGVNEIFRSGSGGIVAARRAKNGSSLLAVADSHVVVLHDTRKGMQKSYKLRGSDVGQYISGNWGLLLMIKRDNFVYFDMPEIRNLFSSPPLSKMQCKHTLYKNQSSSILPITIHRLLLYLPYHPISICYSLLLFHRQQST